MQCMYSITLQLCSVCSLRYFFVKLNGNEDTIALGSCLTSESVVAGSVHGAAEKSGTSLQPFTACT